MRDVRTQYERFPYPPVPSLALPRRGQGKGLSYELGTQLAYGAPRSHDGIRILVAGAGTLEALVVAQSHPRAKEVVAVDISEASLERFRKRLRLSSLVRFAERRAPVRTMHADLRDWEDGSFDLILASNVLHHLEDPAAALGRLARWLRPGGVLRVVTYPKASRIWMRETSRWLGQNGVTPETPLLHREARRVVHELPTDHPVRSCFDSQAETRTDTGIVDAFLHACENPLSPHQWCDAATRAGLVLAGETQTETSRSEFLDALLPELRDSALSSWDKLQILDDLLELCANPVLWFRARDISGEFPSVPSIPGKRPAADSSRLAQTARFAPTARLDGDHPFTLPSRSRWEIAQGLDRVEALLEGTSVRLPFLLERLWILVGPRACAPPRFFPTRFATHRILSGLSILDHAWYDLDKVRELSDPEVALEILPPLGSRRLHFACANGQLIPAKGKELKDQAAWLQLRYGPLMHEIPVLAR